MFICSCNFYQGFNFITVSQVLYNLTSLEIFKANALINNIETLISEHVSYLMLVNNFKFLT